MAVIEKGNLTNINRCTPEVFNQIIEGSHATETYDDNAIYEVILDDPLVIGVEGSGLTVDTNNNLKVQNPVPSVTESDNGKVLTVVNGAWAAASLPLYNGEVE